MHMWKIASLVGVTVTLAAPQATAAPPPRPPPPSTPAATFLMTTTENIGRPYSTIDGSCVVSTYSLGLKNDQFTKAINTAQDEIAVRGKALGADAYVGMNFTWDSPRSFGEIGHVLLCGTYVKFK